jgi:hypothetical protein
VRCTDWKNAPLPELLHRDELNLGALARDHFDRVRHERLALERVRDHLVDVRHLARVFRHDQDPAEVRRAGLGGPTRHPHRMLEPHAARHVEEDAVVPEGRVQRGELAFLGRHGLGREVLADEVLVRVERLVERLEHDALPGELLLDVRVDDVAVDEHEVTRRSAVLGHRLAKPLGPRLRVVGCGLRLAEAKRAQVELLLEVGVAPLLELGGREGGALVDVPGVVATLAKPLGLT